jgi:NADH:ubiquinone oxidoreductase subunit 6 (subunit J)
MPVFWYFYQVDYLAALLIVLYVGALCTFFFLFAIMILKHVL